MTSAGQGDDDLLHGRYRLRTPLGRGGMGTVWRAYDETLGRDVAVKEVVYPPTLSDEERRSLRTRTLREARAIARLSHRAVVTVYDVVTADDRPWIVMELVPGRSLAEVLRADGPLSPVRAAEVGEALLGALTAAHEAGVVHRDVKPANVLLADDGRVVLTDFGIAAVEGDPSLTSTGLVLGSPAYVAPERARGGDPGPASDLWALGATLYAAVEGRAPFERGTALATLGALVTEEPEPPRSAGPLEPAIRELLVKDPEARANPARTRALLRAAADDATGTAAADGAAGAAEAAPGGSGEGSGQGFGEPPARTEVPAAAAEGGGGSPSRRRARVAGAAALLVLAGAVAFAVGDDPPREDGGTPSAAPSPGVSGTGEATPSSPTRTPTASASATPSASPTPATPTASPDGSALPEGFVRHRDRTGFSVAVPRGWRVVRDGTRVDFRDPQGGRFLRIDQTRQPKDDPVADWKRQEDAFASRYSSYRRVRLEAVDYRSYDAADWEFTFVDGGSRHHVLNRAAVTAPDRAYALYWSTRADRWAGSRDQLDVVLDSFRPAG